MITNKEMKRNEMNQILNKPTPNCCMEAHKIKLPVPNLFGQAQTTGVNSDTD